jgi:hypothetical protein
VTEANPEIAHRIQAAGVAANYNDSGRGRPVLVIHGSGPGVTAWADWVPHHASAVALLSGDRACQIRVCSHRPLLAAGASTKP